MNSTSNEHSAHVPKSKAGVVVYNSKLSVGIQDVIRLEPSKYELVWIKGGTFMVGSNE